MILHICLEFLKGGLPHSDGEAYFTFYKELTIGRSSAVHYSKNALGYSTTPDTF